MRYKFKNSKNKNILDLEEVKGSVFVFRSKADMSHAKGIVLTSKEAIKEAKYWLEDFELALDRLDIDPAIKKFFSQKINSLTMQMINTI